MNGTYKPGGNMNLSGTQGLGLDMEPWAYEARGRNKGYAKGASKGVKKGSLKVTRKGISQVARKGLITVC